MKTGVIDWAVKSVTMAGQSVSGDRLVVKEIIDGVLVAVIDGLGHGPDAAVAAEQAAITIENNANEDLAVMLKLCHSSLARQRGAVISLVKLDNNGTLSWLGVGNVQVKLLRNQTPGQLRSVERPVIKSGLVGSGQLPLMQPVSINISNNDLLFLVTDGIETGFVDRIDASAGAGDIAADIINNYGKTTDDALVFVGRYVV